MEGDQAASQQYDEKGNAKHYDTRINSMYMIERTWGTHAAMTFCEITAMKYRIRVGKKPGQSIEQELKKAGWYEQVAKILQAKLGTTLEIPVPNDNDIKSPLA